METKTYEKIKEEARKDPAHKKLMQEKEKLNEGWRKRTLVKELEEIQNNILTLLIAKNYDDATEIIAKWILEFYSIYTTKDDIKSEMWVYDEGVYIPQGKSHVKEQCRKILRSAYNPFIYNRILVKIEADTFIEQEEFFRNDVIEEIPVLNGILNIFTGELKPFNPNKIFFNKIPVKFDVEANCPKIDEFLSNVLKESDDRKVFYEICGFGLLKEYRWEKAFMYVGNGRNGKGKTIELKKRLVGDGNWTAIPLSQLKANSTSVSELFGRMFNLAGDLSSSSLKETGTFKSLTGRDPITCPRKYLRDLNFVSYAKQVFACNELPRVYDYSDGFWDRWVLLEFPYKFVDQKEFDAASVKDRKNFKIRDDDIINKITTNEEMSGLLNKSLLGLHRLIDNNSFSYSKGTKEIKDTWIRKSDSFMAFCLDNIDEDALGSITKKDLRQKYVKYCREHRLPGSSDKGIKITLQEMFGVIDEYITSLGSSNQEWCWMGIKFKGN